MWFISLVCCLEPNQRVRGCLKNGVSHNLSGPRRIRARIISWIFLFGSFDIKAIYMMETVASVMQKTRSTLSSFLQTLKMCFDFDSQKCFLLASARKASWQESNVASSSWSDTFALLLWSHILWRSFLWEMIPLTMDNIFWDLEIFWMITHFVAVFFVENHTSDNV